MLQYHGIPDGIWIKLLENSWTNFVIQLQNFHIAVNFCFFDFSISFLRRTNMNELQFKLSLCYQTHPYFFLKLLLVIMNEIFWFSNMIWLSYEISLTKVYLNTWTPMIFRMITIQKLCKIFRVLWDSFQWNILNASSISRSFHYGVIKKIKYWENECIYFIHNFTTYLELGG